MSIWASDFTVGWDDFGEHLHPDGVVSYADGWSNHYPSPDVEKPAAVHLAHIPYWCVPGVEEGDEDDGATGPWVRLMVCTWDEKWKQPMCPDGATVNLSPDAARALGEALIEWADGEHVEPRP